MSSSPLTCGYKKTWTSCGRKCRHRNAGWPVTETRFLNSQLLHFFVVVLAVEDVPFLRAFRDRPFLAFNFCARSHIDLGFCREQLFQNAARLHADRIRIFNELNVVERRQRVSHAVGKPVHLVARKSHSTALYLRTSSPLTFLNIS